MFLTVVAGEFAKLRHSRTVGLSLAAFALLPLAAALFVWIIQQPARAASLGLLGTKAQLVGVSATWPGYLTLLNQVVGGGGLVVLGFIVAYVFGREYSEGTAKNMLTLPVRRGWFALGKLVVAAAWWLGLAAAVTAEGFLVGAALHLPGWTGTLAAGEFNKLAAVAGLAFLLSPAVAWVAVFGRGYLAPLAFTIVMLVLGNVFSKTGWAPWFPWSAVPLLIGSVGAASPAVAPGSIAVSVGVFFAGILACMVELHRADVVQ